MLIFKLHYITFEVFPDALISCIFGHDAPLPVATVALQAASLVLPVLALGNPIAHQLWVETHVKLGVRSTIMPEQSLGSGSAREVFRVSAGSTARTWRLARGFAVMGVTIFINSDHQSVEFNR